MLTSNPDSLFSSALKSHLRGELATAKAFYQMIIQSFGDHRDTLHHLGLLEAQLGNFAEAITLIKRSVAVDPMQTDALSNLGYFLNISGKYDQASVYCKQSIALDSRNDSAWANLGNAQRAMGLLGDANASFSNALKLQPNNAQHIYNLANVLIDLNDFENATILLEKCIAIDNQIPEAHNNIARCFIKIGHPEKALSHTEHALKLRVNYADAWNNRGNALSFIKHHQEALASYDRAIRLKPDYLDAWFNRGVTLCDLKCYAEALSNFDRVIEMKPDHPEAWNNRGNLLFILKHPEDALVNYNRAIELMPDYSEARNNRGNLLCSLKRHEEALADYNRCIEMHPDCPEAYFNKAFLLLHLEDFDAGWPLYEWRWKKKGFATTQRDWRKPLWLGTEPLMGKTILLHAEQGLGDTIQFCRFAKEVTNLGGRVILEVQPPLVRLLQSLEGVHSVITESNRMPDFDYHCPLMSLPLALKVTPKSIPDHTPYLKPSPERLAFWSENTKDLSKPTIGFVHAGNRHHKNDHHRSISFRIFQRLISPRFQWVSLQKDLDSDAQELFEDLKVLDFSTKLSDFEETAALVSRLDLVISIDSSVAHLAGALNKPIWLLLPYYPDFRWPQNSDRSKWYTTMRLFKQPKFGDWDSVIQKVTESLDTYF
jgi:tetratricopeptide (TPR) repeat protein